jgi:hypothetical protein
MSSEHYASIVGSIYAITSLPNAGRAWKSTCIKPDCSMDSIGDHLTVHYNQG